MRFRTGLSSARRVRYCRDIPLLLAIQYLVVGPVPKTVPKRTAFELVLSYPIRMKMSDLTPEQLSSVPCPTCGVGPGEPCLLHSGTPRTGPHVERKLSAAEAIEKKRSHGGHAD